MILAASTYSTGNDFDYTPFIAVWVVCGLIGAAIGSSKNLGCAGFMLGVLLGPIGLIVIAVMAAKPASTLDRIQARPETDGWHPDPLGRFDARYFDGDRWTQHVGRVDAQGNRQTLEDPI